MHERKDLQYDINHSYGTGFSFSPNFHGVLSIILGTAGFLVTWKLSRHLIYLNARVFLLWKSLQPFVQGECKVLLMQLPRLSLEAQGIVLKNIFPLKTKLIFSISCCTRLPLIQVHGRFMLVAVSHPVLGQVLNQDIGRGVLFVSLGPNPQICLVYRQTWLKGVKPQGEGHIIRSLFF